MFAQIIFDAEGRAVSRTVFDRSLPPVPPGGRLAYNTADPALIAAPLGSLVAVIEEGRVVGVIPDPAYTPPEPQPDPTQVRLEALEAAVANNILASPHDRRWLAQKERAKIFGIPWLKDHPEATGADLEAAVLADLAATFPGEPVVASVGVIQSYAVEAAARGYIPEATFEALRALVVASTPAQLQAMLAAL